ncbi:hypothetical protein GGX14DRAFT_625286 [Mycena pura]|uniref:Uncharacterized protein n=1 Tax=Mycena pura TaxID=153505 RepID=A0AAD6VEF2_9AGAR|nr:hypothetical protein GGX14DRAFT_625286 [Mycena pura]
MSPNLNYLEFRLRMVDPKILWLKSQRPEWLKSQPMKFKIHQARVSAAAADLCSRAPRQTTRHSQGLEGDLCEQCASSNRAFSRRQHCVSTSLASCASQPGPRRSSPASAGRLLPVAARCRRLRRARPAVHAAIHITPNTKQPQRAARPSAAQAPAPPMPIARPPPTARRQPHAPRCMRPRGPRPPTPTVSCLCRVCCPLCQSTSPKTLRRPGPAICARACTRGAPRHYTDRPPPPVARRLRPAISSPASLPTSAAGCLHAPDAHFPACAACGRISEGLAAAVRRPLHASRRSPPASRHTLPTFRRSPSCRPLPAAHCSRRPSGRRLVIVTGWVTRDGTRGRVDTGTGAGLKFSKRFLLTRHRHRDIRRAPSRRPATAVVVVTPVSPTFGGGMSATRCVCQLPRVTKIWRKGYSTFAPWGFSLLHRPEEMDLVDRIE